MRKIRCRLQAIDNGGGGGSFAIRRGGALIVVDMGGNGDLFAKTKTREREGFPPHTPLPAFALASKKLANAKKFKRGPSPPNSKNTTALTSPKL